MRPSTEHVLTLLDGATYAHPEMLHQWSTWKHPVTGDNVAHYLGAPLGPVPQHLRDKHTLRIERVLAHAQHLLSTPNAMGVMPIENPFWEAVKDTVEGTTSEGRATGRRTTQDGVQWGEMEEKFLQSKEARDLPLFF